MAEGTDYECPHPFFGAWGTRKMSFNYALGILMYSCRFCS